MVEKEEDQFLNTEDSKKLLEQIFGLPPEEESEPASWLAWRRGYAVTKPFSLQGFECRNNGNQYLEMCNHCGKYLIICKKYGGQCSSRKCREERLQSTKDLHEKLKREENNAQSD